MFAARTVSCRPATDNAKRWDVRLISRVPRRASNLLTAFETVALEMFNLTAARAKECHSATFARIASLLDQAMPDFTGLIRATINFVENIPRSRDGIDIKSSGVHSFGAATRLYAAEHRRSWEENRAAVRPVTAARFCIRL
jgi:hypothetical protein